jgi:hypothetical protein
LAALLTGSGEVLRGDLGAENFLMRSSLLEGLILFHLGPLAFLLLIPLPATLF